jgi:hypothetical protein
MSGWGRQGSRHNVPRTRGPNAAAQTTGCPSEGRGVALTTTSPLS